MPTVLELAKLTIWVNKLSNEDTIELGRNRPLQPLEIRQPNRTPDTSFFQGESLHQNLSSTHVEPYS